MAERLAPQYDTKFFKGQSHGSRRSAAVVVPLVNELVRPKSVLDVGCGVGTWLAEWASQGVSDLCGLDGEYVDEAMMQIHSANFKAVDLRSPFSLDRRFDLVQSLEVAEHLGESCADVFVKSLVDHADTILFSAAIPGQGGTNHVNEQWPSYWTEKFSRFGLKPFDVVRPVVWADQRVDWWYRQNVLIFSRASVFEARQACIDIVHPECFEANHQYRTLPFRELVGGLPVAFKSAIRNRLGSREGRSEEKVS
jgi:SAM-dependent methyltransferase